MMDRRRVWLVSLGVVFSVGMADAVWRIASPRGAHRPLPLYGIVPPFSLADQHGRAFTRHELEGQVWIADFIFTSCPSQCLLMSDQLRALQRAFAHDGELQFVSFSVDPQHDTPGVLLAYAKRYGADERWYLVTGTRGAIDALCKDGFHLSVAQGRSAHDPIIHSVRFVLMDRTGYIRGYYDAADAREMARLRDDTRRLLQGGG